MGERLDSRKSTIGTIVGGIVVVAITMPITMISGTIIARTISFIRAIINVIIILMFLTMNADKNIMMTMDRIKEGRNGMKRRRTRTETDFLIGGRKNVSRIIYHLLDTFPIDGEYEGYALLCKILELVGW